jgi:cytochrome c nitrite reductase small subunit
MEAYTIQGILLGAVIGVAVGIGVYTFAYAKGWSYLTDDPASCANCHVMREQFDGWLKSSHRGVATCNNCHTPANFTGKYATKLSNGFWHSFFFTMGGYEDNIQIRQHSREITEQACRTCHEEIVGAIEAAHPASSGGRLACLRCHSSVGHLQ